MRATLVKDQQREDFATALQAAMQANDEQGIAKAFGGFFSEIEQNLLEQAAQFDVRSADKALYAQRGLRVLSNEEEGYFKSFIEAAKSTDAKKALTDLSKVLPETELNAIFDDMKAAHPLLDAVQFVDTAALTKFIFDTSPVQKALWGELNTAITQELTGAVDMVELTLGKLTAFMFMSQDMLDLGPVWVEQYVRTSLAEACSVGCEHGIIKGKGVKGEPIGMIKKIGKGASVDPSNGYSDKNAVAVTDFSPKEYGKLLATLSKTEGGRPRVFAEAMLVVNPTDYFNKVMPATTLLTPGGTYARDVFPFPTSVYPSTEVDEGKAVLGIKGKYFFGIGVGNEAGRITQDDSVKFLEDLRTYKIKMYGAGRAYDENCFLLLDISALAPVQYSVTTNTKAAGAAG